MPAARCDCARRVKRGRRQVQTSGAAPVASDRTGATGAMPRSDRPGGVPSVLDRCGQQSILKSIAIVTELLGQAYEDLLNYFFKDKQMVTASNKVTRILCVLLCFKIK